MAKLRFHGDLYEDTNRVINVSNAGSSNPAAPGTANPGSSTAYARADHVHPLQTTVNGHTVNSDVPANAVFTDNNTTYTFAEGSVNGKFSVTPSGGTAQSVPVHGLKALAYKDSLTASEVGALPDTTAIPTKTSDLTNDSGFITTDNNTTYTFAEGSVNGKFSVTPSGGTTQSVTVHGLKALAYKDSLTASEVGALPGTTSIPAKTSDLTNDSGFITTETDPTVPAWAKAASKPTYTASEVGALPNTTTIPTRTSQLTNDSGFITSSSMPHCIPNPGVHAAYSSSEQRYIIDDVSSVYYDSFYSYFDQATSFNANMLTVTLFLGNSLYVQEWDAPYEATDADAGLYYLTDRYTTHGDPDEWGEVPFTCYLVFTRVTKENGATKIKKVTVSGLSTVGLTDSTTTVTLSEETLPRIFSGTSTSVDSSPQEGDICFVYTA